MFVWRSLILSCSFACSLTHRNLQICFGEEDVLFLNLFMFRVLFFAVAKRSFLIFLHNNTFRSFGSFSSDLNFVLSGCANGSNSKRLKSNRIEFPSSFFLTIKTDAPSESKKKNIFRIKATNCNCKIKKYQKKKNKNRRNNFTRFYFTINTLWHCRCRCKRTKRTN